MKRAAAAAVLVLALTGCAPVQDNGDGTVTMPWWFFWQQSQNTTTPVQPAPAVTRYAAPGSVTPGGVRPRVQTPPRVQAPAPVRQAPPARTR